MTLSASDPGAVTEWFVLQQRAPGGEWEDEMSLGAWHDPVVRAMSLAIFRDSEDSQAGTGYRVVRRTETVLAE